MMTGVILRIAPEGWANALIALGAGPFSLDALMAGLTRS